MKLQHIKNIQNALSQYLPETIEIELTRNAVSKINSQFAAEVCKYSWYAATSHTKLYAARGENGLVYLHRYIWEMVNGRIPKGFEIDHINHDPLDNRIENLRCVTHLENMGNMKNKCKLTEEEKLERARASMRRYYHRKHGKNPLAKAAVLKRNPDSNIEELRNGQFFLFAPVGS